jgi:RNA polymerase sigma factor (sigma-70 family)
LQLPAIALAEPAFRAHLTRTFQLYVPKAGGAVSWPAYLDGLYPLDWTVCVGCLEGQEAAWEILFAARTGRSDTLLVDALRARACRLYPRNEERQDNAVTEFWGHLLVPETENGLPVLARYDGQRPLAPWLIRVFQNWHLSKLRRHSGTTTLPDDDIAMPLPPAPTTDTRWHEAFVTAGRDWLDSLPDSERLILGLRWRYKMSQRDVAALLGVHEGTISRQTDKLRDRALEAIGRQMIEQGWAGEDFEDLILTEMGGLLVDDPRLSADQLGRLLAARGKSLPPEEESPRASP